MAEKKTAPKSEAAKAEDREFTGDGKGLLRVAGCTSVQCVSVGGFELPKDVYSLEEPGKDAYLTRAATSNDGVWQNGATVAVSGTWLKE